MFLFCSHNSRTFQDTKLSHLDFIGANVMKIFQFLIKRTQYNNNKIL